MMKPPSNLPEHVAKQNVIEAIQRRGLYAKAESALKDNGRSFDSATAEQIRQAGVVAVFESHRGEPAYMRRDAGKRDDEIIAEFARAIGVVPVTEHRHYIKYAIPYKKAYHTL